MSKWMPIEMAPRDGTEILVSDCRVSGGFMNVVSYELVDGSDWVWHTNDGISYHDEAYTHWMHIPALPPPKPQKHIR